MQRILQREIEKKIREERQRKREEIREVREKLKKDQFVKNIKQAFRINNTAQAMVGRYLKEQRVEEGLNTPSNRVLTTVSGKKSNNIYTDGGFTYKKLMDSQQKQTKQTKQTKSKRKLNLKLNLINPKTTGGLLNDMYVNSIRSPTKISNFENILRTSYSQCNSYRQSTTIENIMRNHPKSRQVTARDKFNINYFPSEKNHNYQQLFETPKNSKQKHRRYFSNKDLILQENNDVQFTKKTEYQSIYPIAKKKQFKQQSIDFNKKFAKKLSMLV